MFGVLVLLPLVTVALPATVTLSYDDRMELLVDQVYPDITTWLTRDQISTLFTALLPVLKNSYTVEEISRQMVKPIMNTLTNSQRQQAWASIQKAQDGFGGLNQFKIIFFHGLDAVQDFVGDSMQKDRAEINLKAQTMTSSQVRSSVLQVLQSYFNVEFGQKIIDTVKYSMTEEDWLVAIEDASQYLTIDNFDLSY